MPGFELIKMEDFGARDANAKDLCAKLVRESDLLVGLMGHYYGSCPPNDTVSFTELEYRTAKERLVVGRERALRRIASRDAPQPFV